MPEHEFTPVYSGIWIPKASRVWLQAWTSVTGLTLRFCARSFLKNGEIVPVWYHFPLSGGGTQEEFFIIPSIGLLESVVVYIDAGTSVWGDVWIQSSLMINNDTTRVAHRIILQGYIGGAVMLGYPGSTFAAP